MNEDDEEHDLIEAIENADLETLLPRLATYAEKRLSRVGWFSTANLQMHRMSPMELVNLAIDHCLRGERRWRKRSGYPDLESFLRGVIKSLLSSAVKSAQRDKVDLEKDGNVDCVDTETADSTEEFRAEILKAIEACAGDDNDLTAFYLTVLEGHTKREDIAVALGWDVARVSAARIKLQRRLEKHRPDLFGDLKKRRAS